jgi:hypothetical protein
LARAFLELDKAAATACELYAARRRRSRDAIALLVEAVRAREGALAARFQAPMWPPSRAFYGIGPARPDAESILERALSMYEMRRKRPAGRPRVQ